MPSVFEISRYLSESPWSRRDFIESVVDGFPFGLWLETLLDSTQPEPSFSLFIRDLMQDLLEEGFPVNWRQQQIELSEQMKPKSLPPPRDEWQVVQLLEDVSDGDRLLIVAATKDLQFTSGSKHDAEVIPFFNQTSSVVYSRNEKSMRVVSHQIGEKTYGLEVTYLEGASTVADKTKIITVHHLEQSATLGRIEMPVYHHERSHAMTLLSIYQNYQHDFGRIYIYASGDRESQLVFTFTIFTHFQRIFPNDEYGDDSIRQLREWIAHFRKANSRFLPTRLMVEQAIMDAISMRRAQLHPKQYCEVSCPEPGLTPQSTTSVPSTDTVPRPMTPPYGGGAAAALSKDIKAAQAGDNVGAAAAAAGDEQDNELTSSKDSVVFETPRGDLLFGIRKSQGDGPGAGASALTPPNPVLLQHQGDFQLSYGKVKKPKDDKLKPLLEKHSSKDVDSSPKNCVSKQCCVVS